MNQVVLIYTALGLAIVQFCVVVQAYREHKVHNIVLYPDKHSWCKTTTIKQVISYPGCTSVEIDNNVCVGACFSYSIPHTEPSDPGEVQVIVPYCDSCQPSETTWQPIILECNKNDADTASQLIKHVQIIQNCSCTPCDKDSHRLTKFADNNEELLLQQSVDSELLDALQARNETDHLESDHWKKMHLLSNQKLIALLRSIQANDTDHDREQLLDLFNVIQDPTKHKIKAKNINDFLETLQNNKTELDAQRLAELLLKFEYPKATRKLEKETTNEDQPINVGESTDVEEIHSNPEKENPIPSNVPIAVWVQNSYDQKTTSTENIHEHRQHLDDVSIEKDAGNEHPAVGEEIHHRHLHKHHLGGGGEPGHQHHVNDNIVAHGHLTHGPHGSLIIKPDRIHEKLDVNAHELKPNHAGTFLSYHSHSGEGNAHQ